jgi:membrane fusion protein (multidrug efflux system)
MNPIIKKLINFYIPILALLLLNACGNDKGDDKKAGPKTKGNTQTHYQLAPVEKTGVTEVERLPGQLAAYQEVSIFPKVNGYVKTVLVDIGSHVQQGQLLMVLEAPELEQASIEAKEKYARAMADYTISRENYGRLKEASLTRGAVSPMQLESAKAKTVADSALGNAEKANWDMQETMTAYLRVTAPFEGVITLRNVHPGALVSAEGRDKAPMLELKQINHLRLQVDIPENIAADLRQNDSLSFYLNAFPGKRMTGRIARKSMNINMQFRSERVELDVYNPKELLAPGMYADVVFESKGNPGALSVPKSAVVTSTERKFVLAVRNGKTVKVDVSTGNQSADRIEVFGDLQPADSVITVANDEIREGMEVR